jgi:tetratricopeptide (TPR) repeat protein
VILRKNILFIVCAFIQLNCQGNTLINDSLSLGIIKSGLDQIYNYEFDAAYQTLDMLKKKYPEHPVTPIFEGFIHYWKNYPLMPGGEGSEEFELAMKKTWEMADKMKDNPGSNIEGVFFNLMARSFMVMYFSDNGIPAKAITHLRSIYRDVIDGFELQDDFIEFIFITGLYDYYREAFIDAHPVYKPVSIFFRKGNKERGLEYLRRAARECDFMHVEAAQFLTLIHVNFESNPDSAVKYASRLFESYPQNGYFQSKCAEMKIVNQQFDEGLVLVQSLMEIDDYNRMKGSIYMGMYQEKHLNDLENARRYYEKGLKLAEPFGKRADYSKAYAYMGLSRYYSLKSDSKLAREFRKKAGDATSYKYVLEE